jgi:5-oxoprolinase (ATP-hydrolysing)
VEINKDLDVKLTPEEVALGFIKMANETMARPIRNITEARGFATNSHNLVTFGGAGGQHACAIARNLGIPRIIIHKYSSILSAYGIGLANIVSDISEPSTYSWSMEQATTIGKRFEVLREKVQTELEGQGIEKDKIEYELLLSMRYEGTDTNISISTPEDGDFGNAFVTQHRREFAFVLEGRKVVVDSVRVRGVGRGMENNDSRALFKELENVRKGPSQPRNIPKPERFKDIYFDGKWVATPLFLLRGLNPGDTIQVSFPTTHLK